MQQIPKKNMKHLHLEMSVKFGIDLNNRDKDYFLKARDHKNHKEVTLQIHKGQYAPDKGPHVKIDGKETKNLLEIANSGQYTFSRYAHDVERIKQGIDKSFEEGQKRVFLGTVENGKVKEAFEFDKDKDSKSLFDFLEVAFKSFQKCVFMTEDEFGRMKELGREVSISSNRLNLGNVKSPTRAKSLER